MKITMRIDAEHDYDRELIGRKGQAFTDLVQRGIPVPETWCVSSRVYAYYLEKTGLKPRLPVILNRKRFEDMRWEEVWDLSLQIRNLFLRTPLPPEIASPLTQEIAELFGERLVAIRSSVVTDPGIAHEFSDLHDSYLAIQGAEAIIRHIRLVWSSLWSYDAILLNQELGLSSDRSRMAVLLQPTIEADASGFAFTRVSQGEDVLQIEAVHGHNRLLARDPIAPDIWTLRRHDTRILGHEPGDRRQVVTITRSGVRIDPANGETSGEAPLASDDLRRITEMSLRIEAAAGKPQCIEWTIRNHVPVTLNVRPCSDCGQNGVSAGIFEQRSWQQDLSRNHSELKLLRETLETVNYPRIQAEIDQFRDETLADLSDAELLSEVLRRRRFYETWRTHYWSHFIPLVHGIRLFGREYNDRMEPADPFEFLTLLTGTPMISVRRNDTLRAIARSIPSGPGLADAIRNGDFENPRILELIRTIETSAAHLSAILASRDNQRSLLRLLLQLTNGCEPETIPALLPDREALETRFIGSFDEEDRQKARELLEFARTSYRLRDDDNILLGKIESIYRVALREATDRLSRRGILDPARVTDTDVLDILPGSLLHDGLSRTPSGRTPAVRIRQAYGQPAVAGIARGRARVIRNDRDLFSFQQGEIMICDSIDPNMTFVAPLCSGIVERRGGMLVHGAIIAREYGIPCITGIPDATTQISTGDALTIDGYLGLVIVG